MKTRTSFLIAAGLLCGTAIPALAQGQSAGNQQSCERLSQLIEQNEDRFRTEWIEHANGVVQEGQPQDCAQYVTQAEQAAQEMDQRERRDQQAQSQNQQGQQGQDSEQGRIVVEQPQPRISVQQNAPEITYNQPEPRVNVRQGQPEIIVRQAEPTIRVEMPQPRISIQQPEPEIVVRMPEPDVSVSVPEPQINVSRNQPEVQVRQPESAQVEVERDQPVVRRQNSGDNQQAQVNVERQQPQVRYESAEPNVEFQMTGEPQVSFERSGEPRVRFENMQDQASAGQSGQSTGAEQQQQQQASADQSGQTSNAEQRQQQANAQNSQNEGADEQATASVDREQVPQQTYQMLRGDGQQESSGQPTTIAVSEIEGRDIVNQRGEELGTVERVIRSNDRIYVVLTHGGFLGLGEDQVALPLDRISSVRGDDQLLLRGMSEEDIEQLPEVNADAGQELQDNQQVQISQS